jgi:hypothetical protein
MANRTMAGKMIKLIKQRRKAPRPTIPAAITPNRGVLQQYKMSAAGLGVPEHEIDDWIKRLYGREVFKGTPSGRAEVIRLATDMLMHVPTDRFVEIIDNCYQRALLWFNVTHDQWVITHTDKRRCMFRRSIVYPSKDVAMAWYERGRVTWVLSETTVPVHSG